MIYEIKEYWGESSSDNHMSWIRVSKDLMSHLLEPIAVLLYFCFRDEVRFVEDIWPG